MLGGADDQHRARETRGESFETDRAYAFDAEMTEQALRDPWKVISADPLADAWGLPHGFQVAETSGERTVPRTEMLYLDKAWHMLQQLSARTPIGTPPRPAHRMFEGQVAMIGLGWLPWVRALAPRDVVEIADDLVDLRRHVAADLADHQDAEYVLALLRDAEDFVAFQSSKNRGFAYMIG